MPKKGKHPLLTNIEVTDIAAEGKAIAKVNEMVVFISGAIPGDIVDVQINRKRKNYREGYPVFFHKYSEKRINPECSHFGTCGGCTWQNLPYTDQLYYKTKQVADNLKRIGKVEIEGKVLPILPSENTFNYRNKLEYTFSAKRWVYKTEFIDGALPESLCLKGLGFHIPGMFDKVLDIEKCHLQKDPSNRIRIEIKNFALANEMDFFDLREQTGFLRNIIIRTTENNGNMLIVVFHYEQTEKRTLLLNYIKESFPEITSLYYIINQKKNDSISDQEPVLYHGEPFIEESIGTIKFRIGPKSFFQTNTKQAEALYNTTADFAGLSGNEIVYDLYTGTGTIANYIAAKAKKVVGVEYIEEAIADAKINSGLNNIENTSFFAGDMKDIFTENFIADNGAPDVVILDPPRAGIHQNVVDVLLKIQPSKIVYVSCNPATQARDIMLLSALYEMVKSQPVDMFPHTHHVENVALLVRKH